jgi:hypothetical protein
MRQASAVLVCLGLVSAGCSGTSSEKQAASAPAATVPTTTVAAQVKPYVYPAPVEGHFEDANYGNFDLRDGIAYASSTSGTVVLATEKAIASPILAATTCPMTYARALLLIRNSGALESALDASGKSPYFSPATPYNGQGREEEVGGHYWTMTGKLANGRIAGKLAYKGKGGFTFDLPVTVPKVDEIGFGDRVSGTRIDTGRRAPSEAELTAAYTAIRKAALAKDLAGILAAQGFDAAQSEAIRGLPKIDADLAAHADRFLTPGDGIEPDVRAGYGQIGAHGKNSKGEAFSNYYEFAPCGDKLVLVSIGLNPQ